MKKFIAFYNGTNSKVVTRAEALAWATKQLGNNSAQTIVYVAEVMETVERQVAPIATKTFFAELDPSVAEEKGLSFIKKTA